MNVDVLTSGIWQTNTTLLSHGDRCVVIDPAYFPRELEAIAIRVRELGGADAVVFTHGHWDHVMGHAALPGVPGHARQCQLQRGEVQYSGRRAQFSVTGFARSA